MKLPIWTTILLLTSCHSFLMRSSWSPETDYNLPIEQPSLYYSISLLRDHENFKQRIGIAERHSFPLDGQIPEMHTRIDHDSIVVMIIACGETASEQEYFYRDGVLLRIRKNSHGLIVEADYRFSHDLIFEQKKYFDERAALIGSWITTFSESDQEGQIQTVYVSEDCNRIYNKWFENHKRLMDCVWQNRRPQRTGVSK